MLFALGIAADSGAFIEQRPVGGASTALQFGKLMLVFGLEAKVVDTLAPADGGNCKVDAWIFRIHFA